MKALTRLGRKQFTDWAGGGWTPLGGYGAPGRPAQVTRAINTYGGTDESSATVFACVRKIADEMASYDWQLVDTKDKLIERTQEYEELYQVLEEPDEDVTYFDWIADIETDLCLVGNSFYIKDEMNGLGQPQRLPRLFPHDVSVAVDAAGRKIGYVVLVRGRQIPFTTEEILHFRTRNPFNKYLGMGIVEAILREVNTDIAEAEHISSFFMNGAKIAGVLTLPNDVDEPTFQRLKKEVEDQYNGPVNAYKTLIAAGATDFKPVSTPPAAAGVVELRRMSQDAIYKGFGMPEFLLGGVAQGGIYKMSEAQYIFFGNMKPKARRLQERMTISLTSAWGGVKFEVLPEMNESPEDQLTNAEKLPRVGASLNETRMKAGLPPIPDPSADVPLVPTGFVPFGTVAIGNQIRQLTDDPVMVPRLGPGQKEPSQLPSPLDTSRRPRVLRDDKRDQETSNLVRQPALPEGFEQRGNFEPKYVSSEVAQQVVNGQASFLATATPEFAKVFRDFFTSQEHRALQAIAAEGKAQVGLEGRKGQHSALKSFSISSVFDLRQENELLVEAFSTALDRLGELALETPRRLLEGLTTGISWSETSEYIWAAREELCQLVKRVNETTRDRLKTTIEQGVERGYSVPQIATGNPDEGYGGITGAFSQARGARAETIARTESAFLYNAAGAAANDEAGIEEVEILDGTDYDEACKKANGERWSNSKFKKNPIQHPNCVRAGAPLVETKGSPSSAKGEDDVPDTRLEVLLAAAELDHQFSLPSPAAEALS